MTDELKNAIDAVTRDIGESGTMTVAENITLEEVELAKEVLDPEAAWKLKFETKEKELTEKLSFLLDKLSDEERAEYIKTELRYKVNKIFREEREQAEEASIKKFTRYLLNLTEQDIVEAYLWDQPAALESYYEVLARKELIKERRAAEKTPEEIIEAPVELIPLVESVFTDLPPEPPTPLVGRWTRLGAAIKEFFTGV